MSTKKVKRPATLKGKVEIPGDKSISHRALIFNALTEGQSIIDKVSGGVDCKSTIRCLRALGASINYIDKERVLVQGVGAKGLMEPSNILNAGNSGTTIRLLAGLLSAYPFISIITGDNSLRQRPMSRVIKPLTMMGASIMGRGSNNYAPLVIKGGDLKGISYQMPVASAQVKSAIILAALFARDPTTIRESIPTRNHTEILLSQMGCKIDLEDGIIRVFPLQEPLKSMNLTVPGDISSAAYWIVAGCIHPAAELRIDNCGINVTRTGLLDILHQMGANIEISNRRIIAGEEIADIKVMSSRLNAIEVGGNIIPRIIDEIPVLAVAACLAKGKTVIKDAGELRIKESDRIHYIVQELRKLGARIEETADGMVIDGGVKLKGGIVSCHRDHRLGMSFAVAGLVCKDEVVISGTESVSISYPGFWEELGFMCSKWRM